MQNLERLRKIRRELKQCKKDFESGKITARECLLTRAKLKLTRLEIESMLDGIWSPSEEKRRCCTPKPAPVVDDLSVSPIIKNVLARFNHLTIDEAIAFARQVREAGGSIETHSGVFAPTRRRWSSTSRRLAGQFDVYCSWTCCGAVIKDDVQPTHVTFTRCEKFNESDDGVYNVWEVSTHMCAASGCSRPDLHQSAPDLKNRNPIGRCDASSTYHLTEENKVRDE